MINCNQLETLNKCLIDWNVNYSVYPYNGYTINEVLCQFFDAINKGIITINEYTKLICGVMDWIKEEGLREEVEKGLDELINNGTFENIINNNIFNDLKNEIELLKRKDEELLNELNDINQKYDDLKIDVVNNSTNIAEVLKTRAYILVTDVKEKDATTQFQMAVNLASNKNKPLILDNEIYTIGEIVIPSNTTIIGLNSTVITPIREMEGRPLLFLKGNNITIKNINYKDNGLLCKGITIGDFGSYTGVGKVDNIKLLNVNCYITNKKNPFIQVGHCKNVKISNCNITNVGRVTEEDVYSFGICVHSNKDLKSENIEIKYNNIDGFYVGICSWGAGLRSGLSVLNNNITNSYLYGIDGYHALTSKINDNTVKKCGIGIHCDSGSLLDEKGLGNICSRNVIKDCPRDGIRCEELVNGLVSSNTVDTCGVGISFGNGTKFSSCINNTITNCNNGVLMSNESAPTPIKPYYLACNTIKANKVHANLKNGIIIKGCVGVTEISDNTIICNNTENGDYWGVLIEVDPANNRNPQKILLKNNNMHNFSNYNGVNGYQKGVKISTSSYSKIYVIGNYMANNTSDIWLDYGNADIINNIFDVSSNQQHLNNTDVNKVGNIGLL